MRVTRWMLVGCSAVLFSLDRPAQTPPPTPPVRKSFYLAAPPLNFAAVVPAPPADGTATARADLAAVHAAQRSRSTAEIAAARRDDAEEDIFVYATVLGTRFNAQALPLTTAFSTHVRGEAATVTPALKLLWARPRPFVADRTIHPVCEQKREPSYPSGHAMVGYLEAFALAQMVPERAGDILTRAHQYAENRVLCGVHYPSDIQASYTAALAEFGALSTSPAFRADMAAAQAELRDRLGLAATPRPGQLSSAPGAPPAAAPR